MRKPELLAPAGDLNKLKYALVYGADAVYLSGRMFGLRAYAGNFSADEIWEAVDLTHKSGRKIYVTVNIFAHEEDFQDLPAYLRQLADMKVDGIIVSDPGVMTLALEVAPHLDIHLSTQVNSTNSYAVNYWFRQGIKRVILARELTFEELLVVCAKTRGDLEIFIHGALCMSYSGRCLLSNYLTGRDANRGACTQPCRWKYGLTEEKRPGKFFPLEEDERGTYIFNSHDLCLLPHLPQLREVPLDSYKIEGRMKSVQYVAGTVKVYREAIDVLWDEGEAAFHANLPEWLAELKKISHRGYTAGFFPGKPGAGAHNLESSHPGQEYDFVGLGLQTEGLPEEGRAREMPGNSQGEYIAWVEQRNNFKLGDILEVLAPKEKPWSFTVSRMWDKEGNTLEVARHAQQKIRLTAPAKVPPYGILRRAKA